MTVPNVAIQSADTAITALTKLGLKPSFVNDFSLMPLKTASTKEIVVVRQGVPPAQRVLRGSIILLTAAENDGRRYGSSVAEPVPLIAVTDVADELGFADIGLPSLASSTEQGAPPLILDDSRNTSLNLPNGDVSQESQLATALSLRSDPGVYLIPGIPDEKRRKAAVLKLVIEALLDQPDWRELPGPVGRSITSAINDCESELRTALQAPFTTASVQHLLEAALRPLKSN